MERISHSCKTCFGCFTVATQIHNNKMGINPKPKTLRWLKFKGLWKLHRGSIYVLLKIHWSTTWKWNFFVFMFYNPTFQPIITLWHPFKSLLKLKSSLSLYKQNMGACNHDWKLMGRPSFSCVSTLQPSFSCVSTLHMAHDWGGWIIKSLDYLSKNLLQFIFML